MAQPPPLGPPRNRLLASLPPDTLAQLLPKFTSVVLSQRQVLHVPDTPIDAACFPESGMITMLANLDEGEQVEVGVAGQEGMIGMPLLAGIETGFVECVVQLPGTALRMGSRAFRKELEENAPLRMLLLRYNEAFQVKWPRSFEQNFRVVKWIVGRGLCCRAERQRVRVGLIRGAAVKGCVRSPCVVEGDVAAD